MFDQYESMLRRNKSEKIEAPVSSGMHSLEFTRKELKEYDSAKNHNRAAMLFLQCNLTPSHQELQAEQN